MKKEYIEELEQLTPRQRKIVLGGLENKLAFHKKTGILSYRYDVCPVCKDVDASCEEDCNRCYIQKSCKAPFNDGFRDDPKKGAAYFTEMRDVLSLAAPPNTTVVGGTWDIEGGFSSKIVSKIANEFQALQANGGHLDDITGPFKWGDLNIWMPNISNEKTKVYPKKPKGSVLICSKVMREGYTKADAVTRIFRMHANAVIEIRKRNNRFCFQLVDALGNYWGDDDSSIVNLAKEILALYRWTKGSIRVGTVSTNENSTELKRLIDCTRKVADQVENSIGERYFGNISTRCQKMFSGMRSQKLIIVSPRNTDKRRLEVEDMVLTESALDGRVRYWGPQKPSVDAPIQLALFRNNPEINFFIHGHARIKGVLTTKNYYPCGDMREVPEIMELIGEIPTGIINLKNHGFLMFSSTIKNMEELVRAAEFEEPN